MNQKTEVKEGIFFDKIAILGVGLIGASLALALKENELCGKIIGWGRSEKNLRLALKRGIIDGYSLDVKEACRDADLIALSTPVGAFRDIVERIRGVLKGGAIVTDAGSVKGWLVHEIEGLMPEGVPFIGSHPIAGSDRSGIDESRKDLFYDALCIVTPTGNSDREALRLIVSMWEGIGARVEEMDPFKHDEVYAAVSHLPHVIAYSLVNTVAAANSGYFSYAGQGFKDTTRIALSSPEMWGDICTYNRDNILSLMDIFKRCLLEIEDALRMNDRDALVGLFRKARNLRGNISNNE